ncbi:hypothetical protein GCM10022226_19620 [Sphaerisporangium flaviroseum]|uniref:DUF222 domain-containing protein n=1 Tax=Sphaerisporangium flaviroseum TaxID=509199 RepID=A0ABP7HRK1_9ACTN
MSTTRDHPDDARVPHDELRALVREVVRDLLPALRDAVRAGEGARPVAIRDDDDLNAFALHVLDLARDPGRATDLREGRLRFRLDPSPIAVERTAGAPPGYVERTAGAAPSVHAGAEGAVRRHEKGAVTERHVAEAAAAGARLVLGRRALLTPLAKERVRACGVVVEREG